MPQVSDSGAAAYATPQDFLARYDLRLIGQLTRDDGTLATAADLLTDVNLATALAEASGDVEMACLTGQRYEADDLYALTGNAAAKLRAVVCDIAYVYMRRRRGLPEELPPGYAAAQEILTFLRQGVEVWPLLGSEDAGLVATRVRTLAGDRRAGLVASYTRMFGVRAVYRAEGGGPDDGRDTRF